MHNNDHAPFTVYPLNVNSHMLGGIIGVNPSLWGKHEHYLISKVTQLFMGENVNQLVRYKLSAYLQHGYLQAWACSKGRSHLDPGLEFTTKICFSFGKVHLKYFLEHPPAVIKVMSLIILISPVNIAFSTISSCFEHFPTGHFNQQVDLLMSQQGKIIFKWEDQFII